MKRPAFDWRNRTIYVVRTLIARCGTQAFHATNTLDDIMQVAPSRMIRLLKSLEYIIPVEGKRGWYTLSDDFETRSAPVLAVNIKRLHRQWKSQEARERSRETEEKVTDPLLLIHKDLQRIGDLLQVVAYPPITVKATHEPFMTKEEIANID